MFFTYTVLAVIFVTFGILIYLLIYKFRIRSASQYIWLFLCAGFYIYFTIALREYPEEAVHLLQYSLLSFFVFRALRYRVRDWTVYVTTVFIVLFAGILDEFIQWMMPERYWGLNDVWINLLASMIFAVAVSKGIRPTGICEPVKKYSLKILAWVITANLLFLGLCLSNTPDMVKRYTSGVESISWLLSEEPMTEFGFKHRDETGTFYSRMTLEEIRRIDLDKGEENGKALKFEIRADDESGELTNNHTPYTDKFLYEFLMHVLRRDGNVEEAEKAEDQYERNRFNSNAYAENMFLEKHFGNTLRHSEMLWPDEKSKDMKEKASSWKKEYTSSVGRLITFIDLKTVWAFILGILALVWAAQLFRKKRA